jgi:adenosylcobinamide-GDP ribazoletransferase
MIRSCVTAIRTLTILPVPGKETDKFPSSLPLFPVAGCIIAAFAYIVFRGTSLIPDIPFLSGIIITVSLLILTGALHLDGIADVADGLGGGKTKEKVLEIFKDSRLGTFGVTALVIDVLIKTVMYSWYCDNHKFLIIGLSLIWSRMFQAVALTFVPSATPHKGIAASFSGGHYKVQVTVSFLLLTIICLLLFDKPAIVILLLAFPVVMLLFFIYICMKKIGGLTGDCIGAINEISEVAILFAGCFVVNSIDYGWLAKIFG